MWFNWIGHATVLLQLEGGYVLTDPHFTQRASPFNWIGPKRYFQPPLMPDDLPPIEVVIISHDHYDHLDYKSVQMLDSKVKLFVVPLGVGASLRYWGVSDEKILEMDWWQDSIVNGIKITATPARHFSGRLFARNNTLWNSYVIEDSIHKIYFAGDSGFFEKYEEIGHKHGPFRFVIYPHRCL